MEFVNAVTSRQKMPLTIDYACIQCGQEKTNQELESMVCECGGDYRPTDKTFMQAPVFDAFLDPQTGKYLTSYTQQEKAGRAYRTPQHPTGLNLINDKKEFLKECKRIRKNRVDYIRAQYAKSGEDPSGGKPRGTFFSYGK